ncbi:beta-propeller domain-containing protein [Ligaoa zhengdingensis]|uniref:beta-propeller domain-containing protein n=2 Tax=Ligaoa zhengdingensis TaxID=2763658 RepID=UPI0031BBC4A3
MTDFYEQDQENLNFISEKLQQIDREIPVPESVTASRLIQRMENDEKSPRLRVVRPRTWQRAAGYAAAFLLLLGGGLYWTVIGHQMGKQAPAPQELMSSAATACDSAMMLESAPAATAEDDPGAELLEHIEAMRSYYASDYAQVRETLKLVIDAPRAWEPEPMEEEVANEKSDPMTGGVGVDTGFESGAANGMTADSHPDTGGDGERAPGGGDVYSTNVQTQDVDEADIVKTDGEYIYYLSNQGSEEPQISILAADDLTLASTISIQPDVIPIDLFLADGKLAVLSNTYNFTELPRYALYTDGVKQVGTRTTSAVSVDVYDISDPANPVNERTFEQQGDYVSSRLVDDVVYLVSRSANTCNPHYEEYDDAMLVPSVLDTAVDQTPRTMAASDICIPAEVTDSNYTVLSAVRLDDPDDSTTKAVLGGGNTVYMSTDNLYVAGYRYDGDNYLMEAGETTLLKFSVDGTDIDLIAQGSVPGRIDGQFALDEGETGELRIATTTERYADPEAARKAREENERLREERKRARMAAPAKPDIEEVAEEDIAEVNPDTSSISPEDDPYRTVTDNNIYVLDEYLEHLGSLMGLAPEESIYSVRYIGDIAYLVTFEQVDPLFAIDLSDPANPVLLGQLKVPGFSEYLHPIGENTLLGFGYETAVTEDGGVTTQGLKLSLFDVSDPTNPRETEVYRLGDQGSYSPALYDHRAFLHYSSKDIIGIPVTLYEQFGNNSGDRWSRNYKFAFDGLYLFRVTEESIKFVGHLSQSDGITDEGEIYRQNLNIRRGVYIGDRIYLFSDARASMYSLDTLELLEETDL